MSAEGGGWGDAIRLSVGTLTALPVRPPATIDRRAAGRAMTLAPLVGLALGLVTAAVLFCARAAFNDPRLAAAIALAALALMTRGLHLDGLADTADGLGASSGGRQRALDVMRRGDIGPFGAATVTFVVLIQVFALGGAVLHGLGTEAIVTACVTGRLAATWACARGIPAARSRRARGDRGRLRQPDCRDAGDRACHRARRRLRGLAGRRRGVPAGVLGAAGVALGLALAGLLVLRCTRRLGGVTGDVLGAVVEIATLGALLVIAR